MVGFREGPVACGLCVSFFLELYMPFSSCREEEAWWCWDVNFAVATLNTVSLPIHMFTLTSSVDMNFARV